MKRYMTLVSIVAFTAAGCAESDTAVKKTERTFEKTTTKTGNGSTNINADSERVKMEVGEATDAVADSARKMKDEYAAKIDQQLKDLEKQIDELEQKMAEKSAELSDDAKKQMEQSREELIAKRDATRAKLEELKKSTGEAWKEMQKGVDAAVDDLSKASQEAAKKYQ